MCISGSTAIETGQSCKTHVRDTSRSRPSLQRLAAIDMYMSILLNRHEAAQFVLLEMLSRAVGAMTSSKQPTALVLRYTAHLRVARLGAPTGQLFRQCSGEASPETGWRPW